MATASASSTVAANGTRPPNAELPTPPNAPRGSRASFATLKRPYSPANPRLSFPLLVTFCSAPVVYFYSALDKIKRVYLYIVTLDAIGGTIGMSAFLNTYLDKVLDRSAFPSIEIRPLFCSEIEALEDITCLFAKISLPQIMERWFVSNPALLTPLQAIDFSGLGSKENEWLRAEWVAIYKNIVRVLFPNEDPDAVVAKETQFRKS
jgi:hypothetical protein